MLGWRRGVAPWDGAAGGSRTRKPHRPPYHQMSTRCCGGRYSRSPGFTSKAA